MAEFKDNLKRIRKRRKYTQRELANITGYTPQVMSNLERGYTHPNNKQLEKISEALLCSVSDLVGSSSIKTDYEMIMFSDKDAFDKLPKEEQNRILFQLQEQADFMIARAKERR